MMKQFVVYILILFSIVQVGLAEQPSNKTHFGHAEDFGLLLNSEQRDKMQGELQERSKQSFYISAVYRSGNFLIYDCTKGHYACVHKDSFQFCKDIRQESINKRHKVLQCAPLKQFEVYNDCLVRQRELVDFPVEKYFCISSDVLDDILMPQKTKLSL